MPVLNAYLAMLPRLQAEESLRRVEERHAAMAEVAQRDRERIIASWRRQAEGSEGAKAGPEQVAVELALLGIGIKRVKI